MRQFILPKDLDNKGLVVLTGKDFHYIRQVLRLSSGDMITALDSSGSKINLTIFASDEKNKTITLQKCDVTQNEDNDENVIQSDLLEKTEYVLFQFIPKPQKMELIVRQAVECGVSKIVPIIGEYTQSGTEKSLMSSNGKNGRAERIARIIREARQQSGSRIDTKVDEPVTLSEALEAWQNEKNKYSANEIVSFALYEKIDGSETISGIVSRKEKIRKAAIAVGSEGGISLNEMEELKEAGFVPVHFETNILRCETAALYGMASLQSIIKQS